MKDLFYIAIVNIGDTWMKMYSRSSFMYEFRLLKCLKKRVNMNREEFDVQYIYKVMLQGHTS